MTKRDEARICRIGGDAALIVVMGGPNDHMVTPTWRDSVRLPAEHEPHGIHGNVHAPPADGVQLGGFGQEDSLNPIC